MRAPRQIGNGEATVGTSRRSFKVAEKRRFVNAKGIGKFADALPICARSARHLYALRADFRNAAKADTSRQRRFAPCARARHDQAALELRHARKDRQEHHAACRTGRICPRLGKRAQPRAGLFQFFRDVEKVERTARKARIESSDVLFSRHEKRD